MRLITLALALAAALTLAACTDGGTESPAQPSHYGNPKITLPLPIVCFGPESQPQVPTPPDRLLPSGCAVEP